MAASFRRLPQRHFPLSDSSFDLCTDVILDLYNDPGNEFVAWYIGGLQFGRFIRLSKSDDIRVVGTMSAGGVKLPQQPVQVAEPLRPRRALERLVLGKDMHEARAAAVT